MGSNTIPSSAVIAIQDECVLLVCHGEGAQHATGVFGLPAGRTQAGESFVDCAIREFGEETGLVAQEKDLVELARDWTAELEGKSGKRLLFAKIFVCKKYTGELRASEEGVPSWIPLIKLSELDLLPNVSDMIFEGLRELQC